MCVGRGGDGFKVCGDRTEIQSPCRPLITSYNEIFIFKLFLFSHRKHAHLSFGD